MASKIQFKRGTTTQSDAHLGAEGEVIINTTKDTIVVHDGIQTGGYEIIRSDLTNLSANVPAVNITDVDCGIYGSGLFDVDGNEIEAPGAPTIGTATVVNTTTVAVEFTAPAEDGGATIETYTATSSPGGITGTLSQAGSGTITVSGLNESTAYTFTVTATNSYTTGDPSNASSTVTTPATPVAIFSRTIDNPNAYGTSANDNFGWSSAISGNYGIVGTRNEDDAINDFGENQSGKAYIFNNSTGALVHTLDNPNAYGTSDYDHFGSSVAISDTYAIVGAPLEASADGDQSGNAYIFNVSTGALVHTLDNPTAYGTKQWDNFGIKVAISGNYAIVGAYGDDGQSGSAYIFNVSTGALVHTLVNPNPYGTGANDFFGYALAMSDTYAVVAAELEDEASGNDSGKVYIFNVSTGALVHTLDNPNAYGTVASDNFGQQVAISGNYAIISSHSEDDAGGTNSGKVYIFNVSTGALVHTLDNPNAYGTSAGDRFGYALAASSEYVAIGTHSETDAGGIRSGKAYIFNVSTGALIQTIDNPNAYGTSDSDYFGRSVAISDTYMYVTAHGEDDAGGSDSGKVYVYTV